MYRHHRSDIPFSLGVYSVVSGSLSRCLWLRWYSFPLSTHLIIVLFLRHWWVRRKRMNENWNIGVRNGISRTDFRRLFFTVLCVLFVYLPLSLYGLRIFLLTPLMPYDPNLIHGPEWKFILFVQRPVAIWSSWVGIALAITSFVLIGFTRNAKRQYEHVVEWVYDHAPQGLQRRLTAWGQTSELCKERRAGSMSNDPRRRISLVEGYIPPTYFVLRVVNRAAGRSKTGSTRTRI